jgi:hypothetical protein
MGGISCEQKYTSFRNYFSFLILYIFCLWSFCDFLYWGPFVMGPFVAGVLL